MTLTKAQVKYLRKLAHEIKSNYQVGKLGLSDNFIEQIDLALEKHELIKFNILQNSMEEIKEAANEVADAIEAEVVQTIGHTAVLYRESDKEKYQVLSKKVKAIR
ncbi:ribosome assembly RNA-binding protein YhbY [Aerococcaceae bacterium zg-ZJ1578]|uniref:ribosome assembly RNA-binding protein YhbY n=1 Tax=Aerococcaceae TaxID=186827 RepID=UPI0013BAB3E4|nr:MULTISPECIES: ribosome assembly RNA-binding protein YhbY [unclassified Facklamia]MBK0348729.1 ribosome assembly RNA-binding protein YhbY [Aerococcaceae bacterium zg-1578]MBR7926683.1 ribosome assembly RNA-binding protein YhbY [Aerococcaceae bacterium zg-ZUI334]MBS4461636.1 ribosome assembly RNA-binding protein YhbY [Aerococcaceae bacterium zg-B36]QQD65275.1 ribosome assembly RNA-binding protein YhbY [Aerococcaceae bacterium zg-252]NEW63928.1 ribosome assembly RNA-binding protein YhbY [Fackl